MRLGDEACASEFAVDRFFCSWIGHIRIGSGDLRHVCRHKAMGDGKDGYPCFSDVFSEFKKQWGRSVILGLVLSLIALLLYVDFSIAAVYFRDQPAVLSLFISLL